jgi:hypothetical protein
MSAGRDERIIEFVMENPDCIKTQVINFINRGSPVPTHKAIKRLIKEKKLISTPDRFNSSIHHLRVNNRNKLIMIKQLLSKIHIMLEKINKQKSDNKIPFGVTNYSPTFRQVCDKAIRSLLINTDKNVPLESDCQRLYIRIIQVLKELDATFYEPPKDSQKLRTVSHTDNGLRVSLPVGSPGSAITVESIADIEAIKSLIASIEGFKSER